MITPLIKNFSNDHIIDLLTQPLPFYTILPIQRKVMKLEAILLIGFESKFKSLDCIQPINAGLSSFIINIINHFI